MRDMTRIPFNEECPELSEYRQRRPALVGRRGGHTFAAHLPAGDATPSMTAKTVSIGAYVA